MFSATKEIGVGPLAVCGPCRQNTALLQLCTSTLHTPDCGAWVHFTVLAGSICELTMDVLTPSPYQTYCIPTKVDCTVLFVASTLSAIVQAQQSVVLMDGLLELSSWFFVPSVRTCQTLLVNRPTQLLCTRRQKRRQTARQPDTPQDSVLVTGMLKGCSGLRNDVGSA